MNLCKKTTTIYFVNDFIWSVGQCEIQSLKTLMYFDLKLLLNPPKGIVSYCVQLYRKEGMVWLVLSYPHCLEHNWEHTQKGQMCPFPGTEINMCQPHAVSQPEIDRLKVREEGGRGLHLESFPRKIL